MHKTSKERNSICLFLLENFEVFQQVTNKEELRAIPFEEGEDDQIGHGANETSKKTILSKTVSSDSNSLLFYMRGPSGNKEGYTLLSVVMLFEMNLNAHKPLAKFENKAASRSMQRLQTRQESQRVLSAVNVFSPETPEVNVGTPEVNEHLKLLFEPGLLLGMNSENNLEIWKTANLENCQFGKLPFGKSGKSGNLELLLESGLVLSRMKCSSLRVILSINQ